MLQLEMFFLTARRGQFLVVCSLASNFPKLFVNNLMFKYFNFWYFYEVLGFLNLFFDFFLKLGLIDVSKKFQL